ncbi:MAG: SpoIIE family protein phosphatase [Bacteroidota bacterium]
MIFALPAFSQKPEGIPFIRNYSPKEYKESTDNWAIAQDKRGIMYFGNASGVLQYDGINWTLTPVSNNSIVRSIAIDDKGVIYVGAVGELGFLEANKQGVLVYHSLMDKLPPDERNFADVWKTYVTPDGVYFQTFSKLIRIENNSVKLWKPETTFHFSFYVENELYINEREQGLKHIVNDKLVLVEGGDVFKDFRIYSILPYSSDKLLLATREKGLVLMNKRVSGNNDVLFWNAESNELLINSQVYGAVSLYNGHYAFATLQNGVLIIDHKGKVVEILNKQSGLRDNIINYIQTDQQHDLWIALDNGISHVEISSPLNVLNDAQGLSGSLQDIIKFKGILYVATSLGIYAAVEDRFVLLQGISTQTWAFKKFVSTNDTFLLASSEEGIIKIEGLKGSIIQEGFNYNLCQSKIDPRRLFVANADGISSLRYENGKWVNEDYVEGIEEEIRSIVEDPKGDVWLGTPNNGVIKIVLATDQASEDSLITSWHTPYKIYRYDTSNGLPENQYNIPYCFKNKIVFATMNGIYNFNAKTGRFTSSSILQKEFQRVQVYRFVPKDSSVIWMVTARFDKTKETGIAYLQKDNSYSWYSQPFLKISEREIHAIFPDENGVTWVGGPDGLLRYDSKIKKDFSLPFYTIIHRLVVGKDSVIFAGNFLQSNNASSEISYSLNSVEFEFSATSYGKEEENRFSFMLEGHDTEWSKWDKKYTKEYTDLKEGDYVFHVKSKNIYGAESIESKYAFKILPPWYRTIWAYIGYIVIVVCLIYLIIRISVRRLVKAKNQLEKIVKERTAEVVEQKHLIEEKHKEITDSINYAERIQRSFLATKDLLDENLKDHFVFFQPKDVVSGDFYWASKLGNGNFVLATADSTGHGVPGSIMSILNISSLEHTVEEGVTEPAEILNHTRSKIIKRLKKDGSAEGGKDGMDCSLISFDFKNNKLTYAAANNPVWIVREKQLLEFAPDKMPVGKHDKDAIPFTQHTIELQKADVVYALTDGMPDQFGGPKGKKFMYKNLKELLASIAHLPMDEQKETLKSSFNNWKGTLEQVDDVCLIGIRI